MSDVDVIQQCIKVNAAVAELVNEYDWFGPDQLAKKLGWTRPEVWEFLAKYGPLVEWDHKPVREMNNMPEASPPLDADLNLKLPEIPSGHPNAEQFAAMIEVADSALARGLEKLGLNKNEKKAAEALAHFNGQHFKESMDMISSSVLVTAIKLQSQQRFIEQRLEEVRSKIMSLTESTKIRNSWVEEEQMLSIQYVDIGRLLSDIQANWYKGAAQLALVKMKMKERMKAGANVRDITQRSNKPSFSPPTPYHDQGQDPPDG